LPEEEQRARGGVMETMTSLCAECGASLPGVGTYCPACGTSVGEPKPVLGKTGGIPDQIAGALAYVFVIPAIVFLLRDPFKRNRFIRFHAWQSILVAIATAVVFSALLTMMGKVLVIFASFIVAVGWFILWLVLMVKALQGEMFELPWIGALAKRQAGPE
jgi:uncharacterized membrane protein